jgi:protein TonB
MGIEGKVFVEFIVDKDGSITEVTVMKGIGSGCDEEAIRVIKAAPKWNPGKQRGQPVKVKLIVPITFKLG